MSKAELEQAVKDARANLALAEAAVEAWDDTPENNVFASLEEAESEVEGALLDRAHKDCKGSYNCGADTYARGFIVGGTAYIGTLTVEYNRYDKTYYYVDRYEFTFAPA